MCECVCAKYLLTYNLNVITVKLFLGSLILKVPGGLKSQQTLTTWDFLFYGPFKGGYFSSVDLKIGVCVRLQEATLLTGGKKCRVLVEKLLGQQFGVCLWEVSINGGSTVLLNLDLVCFYI